MELARRRTTPIDDDKEGARYVALCGLVFLGILNWRLDVWLAPFYDGDLATIQRVLPMKIVHCLSIIVVAWVAALVFITEPAEKR